MSKYLIDSNAIRLRAASSRLRIIKHFVGDPVFFGFTDDFTVPDEASAATNYTDGCPLDAPLVLSRDSTGGNVPNVDIFLRCDEGNTAQVIVLDGRNPRENPAGI